MQQDSERKLFQYLSDIKDFLEKIAEHSEIQKSMDIKRDQILALQLKKEEASLEVMKYQVEINKKSATVINDPTFKEQLLSVGKLVDNLGPEGMNKFLNIGFEGAQFMKREREHMDSILGRKPETTESEKAYPSKFVVTSADIARFIPINQVSVNTEDLPIQGEVNSEEGKEKKDKDKTDTNE